jgi:hypothetical protein
MCRRSVLSNPVQIFGHLSIAPWYSLPVWSGPSYCFNYFYVRVFRLRSLQLIPEGYSFHVCLSKAGLHWYLASCRLNIWSYSAGSYTYTTWGMPTLSYSPWEVKLPSAPINGELSPDFRLARAFAEGWPVSFLVILRKSSDRLLDNVKCFVFRLGSSPMVM